MRTVTVRLPAAGFSAAMAAMREWLDCNGYEPTKFKHNQEHEAVVVSVEFLNDRAGEAFARRFDRKEPPGSMPRGV
jgi:hypothetical protein